MPKVSIIIPTYNRAYLIAQTLDSIKTQSFSDWECIVVDDGGTDHTPELLRQYTQSDVRFRYFLRPQHYTKGANACRNYGYEQSSGIYIKWFDSDDLMHPDFVKRQVEILEAHPELDFCAAFSKIFTTTANDASEDFNPAITTAENAIYDFIIGKLFFLTPAPLWRRDFLTGRELFDVTLYNAHETDFNFRMLIAGARFTYVEETLFFIRRGHQSIDNQANQNVHSFQSQFDYFDKVYHYLRNPTVFSRQQSEVLQQYTIYRKAVIYSRILQLGHRQYAAADRKILQHQVKASAMPLGSKMKYLLGLYLIWHFKKGYQLIHQKTYDVR